jgi:hypothetical protein
VLPTEPRTKRVGDTKVRRFAHDLVELLFLNEFLDVQSRDSDHVLRDVGVQRITSTMSVLLDVRPNAIQFLIPLACWHNDVLVDDAESSAWVLDRFVDVHVLFLVPHFCFLSSTVVIVQNDNLIQCLIVPERKHRLEEFLACLSEHGV